MTTIGVTDHAIVRWLERVHGIDMVHVRALIAEPCREALEAGATSLHRSEGTYVLSPGSRCVVTILAPGMAAETRQRLAAPYRSRARRRRPHRGYAEDVAAE